MKFTPRHKEIAANGNLPVASRLFYMALVDGKSERLEETMEGSVQGQIAAEANTLMKETIGDNHLKVQLESLPEDFFENARIFIQKNPETFKQSEKLHFGLERLQACLKS